MHPCSHGFFLNEEGGKYGRGILSNGNCYGMVTHQWATYCHRTLTKPQVLRPLAHDADAVAVSPVAAIPSAPSADLPSLREVRGILWRPGPPATSVATQLYFAAVSRCLCDCVAGRVF